jgi:short chain dehydrogenase
VAHAFTVTVMAKDLSPHGASGELVADLAARGVQVDALVNNAGFAQYGPFVEADRDEMDQMVSVNVVALTQLTRSLLPGMIERGWGKIVNLGSIGSFMAAPMTGAYGATKAYVLSLSLALDRGAPGDRRDRYRPLSWADRNGVPGSRRDGGLAADRRTNAGLRGGGRACRLRGHEEGQAVPGHGHDEQALRVREPVPAANAIRVDRRPCAAEGSGLVTVGMPAG